MHDDVELAHTLEIRHLDVRAGQQIDDGGPRHAHHVGNDDQRQRQGRQKRLVDLLPEGHVRADVGQAREPAGVDRQNDDQHVGEKELRHRYGTEGNGVDCAIVKAVAIERGQDAQQQRQGYRDYGGERRQKQRVLQTFADELGDLELVGQRGAEIALHDSAQPFDVAHVGRLVQADLFAELGDRFGGRGLTENFLRQVAGQQLDTD